MPVSQRVDQVEFRGNTAINSLFSEVVKEKETSILILEPNVIDIFSYRIDHSSCSYLWLIDWLSLTVRKDMRIENRYIL